jgi:hypothetical protein
VNRLDRGAVFISILRHSQAAAAGERENRRRAGSVPALPVLGRSRRLNGLSQDFVERYRNHGTAFFVPFFYGPPAKRFIFHFPVRPGQAPESYSEEILRKELS